jgi:ribosomal protein S18 acetylase RimI-like enzyme
MPHMEPLVRRATPQDDATPLLYESARPYYDAYAGSERRARRLLAAVYDVPGHTASWETCWVAEVDGQLIGVLAGFPALEAAALARRFVSLTSRRLPPWRWPGMARHVHAAGTLAPHTPPRSWYVDALAVDPAFRRRGVAGALLHAAEEQAARAGLEGVALDTGLANHGARALYASHGFDERDLRRARTRRIEAAVGGPGFVGYFKPVPARPRVSPAGPG